MTGRIYRTTAEWARDAAGANNHICPFCKTFGIAQRQKYSQNVLIAFGIDFNEFITFKL